MQKQADKNIISAPQAIFLSILYLCGNIIDIGYELNSGRDSWVALLIAFVASLPFFLIYIKPLEWYSDKSFFDMIKTVFGNVVGKIIIALLVWFSIHLSALIGNNFADFIKTGMLVETPKPLIILLLLFVTVALVKSGIEVIGRFAAFVGPIIVFFVVLTLFISIPAYDFSYFKPVLYNGWKPVLKGAQLLFFFPFAEYFFAIVLFPYLQKQVNRYKVVYGSVTAAMVLILTVFIRNLLLLGHPAITYFEYASFISLSLVDIGNFIQGIDPLLTANLYIFDILKGAMCVLFACKGTASLFEIEDYREIAVPIILFRYTVLLNLYRCTFEKNKFLEIYPYYAAFFLIVIPIIVLIVAAIKRKKRNPTGASA